VDGVVAGAGEGVKAESSGRDTAPSEPLASRWRLAPGVGLVEGTLVGGEGTPGERVYALVLPNGYRYRVSEALYRLAELLAGERSVAEVAVHLSQRLGRPLRPAEVAGLIERKLAARGLVVASEAGPAAGIPPATA
jgi:hypothetical protein